MLRRKYGNWFLFIQIQNYHSNIHTYKYFDNNETIQYAVLLRNKQTYTLNECEDMVGSNKP